MYSCKRRKEAGKRNDSGANESNDFCDLFFLASLFFLYLLSLSLSTRMSMVSKRHSKNTLFSPSHVLFTTIVYLLCTIRPSLQQRRCHSFSCYSISFHTISFLPFCHPLSILHSTHC
ncbi:hypothetical protein F5H01DRAFT_350146 [Linnemannia elongata]|nr:hypothetical protein F5H01DRAFT_350146 [Linnemannia elongata]